MVACGEGGQVAVASGEQVFGGPRIGQFLGAGVQVADRVPDPAGEVPVAFGSTQGCFVQQRGQWVASVRLGRAAAGRVLRARTGG